MFFPFRSSTTYALSFAISVSAAPLNERSTSGLFNRAVGDGWLCHFTNLGDTTVDVTLNLPLMLGGLCAKVNFDYEGCESFRQQDANTPQPVDEFPEVPQQESDPDSNPTDAASVDDEENDNDNEDNHKENDGDHDNSHPKPKKAKHHKHPKQSSIDGKHHIGAHNFDDSTDPSLKEKSHKKNHNKQHHKHPKDGKDPNSQIDAHFFDSSDPDSSLEPQSADDSDDDSNKCEENEYYSTELQQCVDKSFFSQPENDSTCPKGKLDVVIKLCLDISLLGLTEPITSNTSVLQSKSAEDGSEGCPSGQQYSSIISACVANKFLSAPSDEHKCEDGWQLDLVLGICLDLTGCQGQDHNLL